ncbi:transcriptional regulator [Chromatiales bacterium (ex Bugula neritina AB1)]|nr:transcriptional regulator [Chromatiales bacterium (ex Bugula neritina AB1)]
MSDQELIALLAELRALPHETEWVEFKHNRAEPNDIGEYLSALANSAALHAKGAAYIVWGVEDGTHNIVGTTFKPRLAKQGNEELENWLLRLLSPRIDFQISEFRVESANIVIFSIQPATHTPVSFSGTEYIRVGSLKKKLKEYPEKEGTLWGVFSATPFEKGVVLTSASSDDVLNLIDYPVCFELLGHSLPDNRQGILQRLQQEKVIKHRGDDRYDITNLGGILFAKDLNQFERLSQKALRVIQYKGNNRIETLREQIGQRGYASGFEGVISFIDNLLPQNEQIEKAFRQQESLYPQLAIRELVANLLVHQDFNLSGTGPMVEIFTDRIEFTNPGKPLIETLRFIDEPPQSRNEDLADLMRRMGICERRGSGIDKVISQVELFQLPAPKFSETSRHTKVTLLAPKSLNDMDRDDRIRACYQHACLRYESNEQMTNASFRDRLGVDKKNYAIASRIIRDAIDANLVQPVDPDTGPRYMRYVPFWAA